MLIQVNVQNFKSFNELNSLNMIASNRLRKQKERLYESDTISLLKSTVIYVFVVFLFWRMYKELQYLLKERV